MQAVAYNMQQLQTLKLPSSKDTPCAIAIDVAIGWKAIPVMLAALACKMTIVPVDPFHHPTMTNTILQQIKPALYVTETSLDAQANLQHITSLSTASHALLEHTAFILYTSGTTGFPKGVMLTYKNIWSNVQDILAYLPMTKQDRMLLIRPLTHASAITGELLPALYHGSTIMMKSSQLSPIRAVQWIAEQQITFCCTTPTVATHLAHFTERYNTSSLRTLMISGEKLLPSQKNVILQSFSSATIGNAYGLTEASPRISCKLDIANAAIDNVGACLNKVNIKIVDKVGEEVASGEKGVLMVTGPNIMKGYFQDRDASNKKMRGEWLYTADLASIKDGELHIHGREDELIIRAGVNIHPTEIESSLLEIEGIIEVLAFAKEMNGGMKVHTWIVKDPALTQQEAYNNIISHQQKHDDRLITDIIEWKESLPRTPSGKLIRPRHH